GAAAVGPRPRLPRHPPHSQPSDPDATYRGRAVAPSRDGGADPGRRWSTDPRGPGWAGRIELHVEPTPDPDPGGPRRRLSVPGPATDLVADGASVPGPDRDAR